MATAKTAKTAKKGPPVFASFTGVRNDVAAEHMEAADLVTAENVDIDNAGRLSRRDGYSLLVAGTDMHSFFAGRTGSLVVDGTTMSKVVGATLTQIASGLTAGLRMSYWEHDARIYHANGVQKGVFENGSIRSWGLTVPASPVAAPAGGNLPPGKYAVVLTRVATDGQESGAGSGTEVVVTDGAIAVTVPAPVGTRVTHHRIYCTACDGAQFYLAGESAGGTFTIADEIGLQAPLTTQFLSPPPAGHLVAVYNGRAYVAVDNRLHPSMPFSFELFRPTDFIPFEGWITMIAPTLDGIFVCDGEKTLFLAGSAPGAFTTREVGRAAIRGTLAFAKASKVGAGQTQFDLPVWLTADGPVVGGPGGTVTVMNDKYSTDLAHGAGFAREVAGAFQYVVSGG